MKRTLMKMFLMFSISHPFSSLLIGVFAFFLLPLLSSLFSSLSRNTGFSTKTNRTMFIICTKSVFFQHHNHIFTDIVNLFKRSFGIYFESVFYALSFWFKELKSPSAKQIPKSLRWSNVPLCTQNICQGFLSWWQIGVTTFPDLDFLPGRGTFHPEFPSWWHLVPRRWEFPFLQCWLHRPPPNRTSPGDIDIDYIIILVLAFDIETLWYWRQPFPSDAWHQSSSASCALKPRSIQTAEKVCYFVNLWKRHNSAASWEFTWDSAESVSTLFSLLDWYTSSNTTWRQDWCFCIVVTITVKGVKMITGGHFVGCRPKFTFCNFTRDPHLHGTHIYTAQNNTNPNLNWTEPPFLTGTPRPTPPGGSSSPLLTIDHTRSRGYHDTTNTD